MDIDPQHHQQRQQPQPVLAAQAIFGQDGQEAGEQWKGVALRSHQPVVERERQRRQQQQPDAQLHLAGAQQAQPQQQPIRQRDHQRLEDVGQWDAAELVDPIHQQLRQPALVEERLAGLGVGKAVDHRDRALGDDRAAGGHVPPEIIGRDRRQQRAQRDQHQRHRQPDMVERQHKAAGAAGCGRGRCGCFGIARFLGRQFLTRV